VERVPASDGADLLATAPGDAPEDNLPRILYRFCLTYPRDLLRPVHEVSKRLENRLVAVEIVDNVLRSPDKETPLIPFDQLSVSKISRKLARHITEGVSLPSDLWEVVSFLCGAGGDRYGEWVGACALHVAAGLESESRRTPAAPFAPGDKQIL
jgi:hypothetical protein